MEKYKTVEAFLSALDTDKRSQVMALRKYITDTNPELNEHIKWNAPSYVYKNEDRITFNVFNKEGLVKLVFHMGAIRKENKKGTPVIMDESNLLEWVSDIRGYVTFHDLKDVKRRETDFKRLLARWLALD